MKRILFSAVLLTGVVVTAQTTEGTVGINTETPKATLEIKPNAKNSAETATTNEGLLIPQKYKRNLN